MTHIEGVAHVESLKESIAKLIADGEAAATSAGLDPPFRSGDSLRAIPGHDHLWSVFHGLGSPSREGPWTVTVCFYMPASNSWKLLFKEGPEHLLYPASKFEKIPGASPEAEGGNHITIS